MLQRWLVPTVALGVLAAFFGNATPNAAPAPTPPALSTLTPGVSRTIHQNLRINIVFVGYEPGAGPRDINATVFGSLLPSGYEPLVRYKTLYGIRDSLGLSYSYSHNTVFASAAYEDAFFGYLAGIATPRPRTLFQNAYNAEAPRALTIGANHFIDAPSVERWLAANPPTGVDTSNYTVYLVNWYGRSDFRFHVYTKTDEPDPDTGANFGNRSSRRMIAWGGTASDDPQGGPAPGSRVWFYDLSAGPEAWSGNYDVTNADLDDDGVMDYRMPPIWEYGNANAGLYRAFNNLSRDLGLVVRFVAINLLFTSSPLYDPMISPPKVPSTINLDLNVYQAEPGVDGRTFLNGDMVARTLGALQSTNAFSYEVNSEPFTGRAADVYRCFLLDVSCFGNRLFGIAFGDLFLFHDDHLNRFIDGDADYEVPVFLYNTTDALSVPLLGFASDNWRDGTQSYVFGFDSTLVRNVFGYGLTATTTHEVGHHVAMSHPHDGYDSAIGVNYGASGSTYYANSGDESNSIMSYIDLNWDFSQFDRDNMARYLTAGYINQANSILARIYASPRAGNGASALLIADGRAANALSAFASREWGSAATHAKAAYLAVLAAAELANVQVEPQNYTADYRAQGRSPHFVDTLDGHRAAP